MGKAEKKQAFINERFNEFTKSWFLHYVFWGAMLFLILGFLDYILAPKSVTTLVIFRLSIVYFLLLIYFVSRKIENINHLYFFAFAAMVMSAIAIERMILNLSGDRSMYYTGLILLNVVVLTFIPTRIWFSIVASCAIYSIYLFPITRSEEMPKSQAFFVYNLILLAIVISALFMRYLNNKSLIREFGLSYELDEYQNNLERLVEERTQYLSDAFKQLERVAQEWRKTVDTSNDIIMLLDKAMNVVKVNRMTTLFFRKTYQEILGNSVYELIEFNEPENLHNLKETKTHVSWELFMNKHEIWFWVTADPILSEENDLEGAVLTMRNITGLKMLQKE